MPRDLLVRPLGYDSESLPRVPDAPDEPESSTDPRIDSTSLTEDLSILPALLTGPPYDLWAAVPDLTEGIDAAPTDIHDTFSL